MQNALWQWQETVQSRLFCNRYGQYGPQVWNLACDYVINDLLKQYHIKPVDQRFAKLSADQIYDVLLRGE